MGKMRRRSGEAHGATDVQHHDERQPRVFGGARLVGNELVPAEQLRQQDRMAEARDREQLREALEQTEHDALEVGDWMHVRGSSSRTCARGHPRFLARRPPEAPSVRRG